MAKEEDEATSSQPLLNRDQQDEHAPENGEHENAAEEGQSMNIQREIYTHPDRAVRWLISKGALRLGSFKVQVCVLCRGLCTSSA